MTAGVVGNVVTRDRWHARDIDDQAFLDAVRHAQRRDRPWVMRWDIETQFPQVPWKVLLAKAKRLIKAGRLEGCWCGCRGDYRLPARVLDR